MTKQSEITIQLSETVRSWPVNPGVYIMRDETGRILYVGKAKNLKNRIRSYFVDPERLSPKTRILIPKVRNLEFTVTPTELEALLLECNLIKKHRPRYNIRLKDDRNFPYVVLDFTHPFPQFRITRKVTISPELRYFGPYTSSIRDISRFILKTFQIRDCSEAKYRNRTRPCLNYEIGTCTAPCVALVSQEKYASQIQDAILFLEGKTKELVERLTSEMGAASEVMEYERAKLLRDRIHAIELLQERQEAVLTDHQKNVDVIGSYTKGGEIQWVVLFVRGGLLTGRRTEKTPIPLEDGEGMQRFLEQFYFVSVVPDEVWVAEDFAERETLQAMIEAQVGRPFLIRVRKGEQGMRLLGMAYENAKLLLEDPTKNKLSASQEVQEALELPDLPQTIEGIDVSNLQGESPAVALVHFSDERPLKSRYRLYYPRTVEGQNDFAMIHEVVTRRFAKADPPHPDLLLIDGGKGQLSAAVKALEDLGCKVPVCSIAKSRTAGGFTLKEVDKSDERIFVPNRKNPVNLKAGTPGLLLLQSVRDEAHRFSVKHHRNRRTKASMEGSLWDSILGIGPKSKFLLQKKFGDFDTFLNASVEQIVDAGIASTRAEKLHLWKTEFIKKAKKKAAKNEGTP